jgi:hypothetical protein
MDVPLIVPVAVSLEYQSDVTLTPGAKKSTQVPQFAQLGLVSKLFVALTVTASATRAGENRHASPLLLPAAIT